jgi:hypothetical protein
MSIETFQVPPGTADGAKASLTDQLAADAKLADGKLVYPDGCPELRPPHRMEWEDRAQAALILGEIVELEKQSGKLKKGQTLNAEKASAFYKLLGAIGRYLGSAAADKDAWKAWPGRLDQEKLIETFNVYQGEAQPGEASSSSS